MGNEKEGNKKIQNDKKTNKGKDYIHRSLIGHNGLELVLSNIKAVISF